MFIERDDQGFQSRGDYLQYAYLWAPRFYTWGLKDVKNNKRVKICPIGERLASKVGVRKTHYREDKASNMLHLNDKKRLDMGKSCIKYFMYIYKIISRNESST